jgi:hypothetical protein
MVAALQGLTMAGKCGLMGGYIASAILVTSHGRNRQGQAAELVKFAEAAAVVVRSFSVFSLVAVAVFGLAVVFDAKDTKMTLLIYIATLMVLVFVGVVVQSWMDRSPSVTIFLTLLLALSCVGASPIYSWASGVFSHFFPVQYTVWQAAWPRKTPLAQDPVKPEGPATERIGSWSGTLVAAGWNKHGYAVTPIDTRRYSDGGVLNLEISVGTGVAAASFDLFSRGVRLPTEGMPNQQGSLASAWNVPRGGMTQITYRFQHGDLFQFGAEANWQSPVGATNSYTVRASVSR